ncbi:MAG: lipopolysaccharide transport periplasmic protein LptA [Stenotrophomonas sp.]
MNQTLPAKLATTALLAVLLLPGLAWSRASDRNQPMTIDATSSDCSMAGDNGKCRFAGNVVIVQGTLEIHADTADVMQKNGEIDRVILTGKQAALKQQMDDGTMMNAHANNMDYNINTETIILTGDYKVESERGTNAGQRMVYNTRSGNMQSGGDGTRVRTVIQPKNKPAAAPGEKK